VDGLDALEPVIVQRQRLEGQSRRVAQQSLFRCYKLESYDATDYYDLIEDGKQASRHYLKGSDHESGMKIYAHIWPLTSGEYAYEISREWPRSKWTYGIVGAWPTETDALEAAKADAAVGS
jgi:hypothetical protein